jgi:GIY-YIG catalytic domain-containing protein
MWYVYILRSINFPKQEYVGATADLKRRLPEHNAGKSTHTAKFRPWDQIQASGIGLVLRIPGQIQSAGIREISQIPLRPGICEEAPLMLKASNGPNFARNAQRKRP